MMPIDDSGTQWKRNCKFCGVEVLLIKQKDGKIKCCNLDSSLHRCRGNSNPARSKKDEQICRAAFLLIETFNTMTENCVLHLRVTEKK